MTRDWDGNGKSVFVTLGASNHTDKEREINDFYATDPIAIDKLIGNIGFIPSVVWECACGTGCLSERLKQHCHGVVSTDVVDRGYGQVQDFLLAKEMPSGCSCIITNPPYKYALEFILHALDLLPDGGKCMMFLKTTFLEGEKRNRQLFSNYPPPTNTTVFQACPLRQECRVSEDARRRRVSGRLRMVHLGEGLQRPHYDNLDLNCRNIA